jgi:hypothetical protein
MENINYTRSFVVHRLHQCNTKLTHINTNQFTIHTHVISLTNNYIRIDQFNT